MKLLGPGCVVCVVLLGRVVPAAQLPPLLRVNGDGPGDWFGFVVEGTGDLNGDGVPDFAVGAHQNKNFSYSPEPGYVRVHSGADGSELFTFRGGASNWRFGNDLCGGTDFDGDGVPDLLVGAFKYETSVPELGLVRIFSGADGSILHSVYGTVWGDRIGMSVAWIGDVDGDGVPDYMFGAPQADSPAVNSGELIVHSGATHTPLFVHSGPSFGAGLGWTARPVDDLDGDGAAELVVGAPGYSVGGANQGAVIVYSGATGAVLHTFLGQGPGDFFGHTVDGIGDLDGDGFADIAVGAPQGRYTGPHIGPGYVRVFSGRDGALLLELHGDAPFDQFGHSVRGVGDVTGDGRVDLLVGAPRAVTLGVQPTGLPGYARLFSGRDGVLMHTFVGTDPDDQFGVSVAAVGDFDGDGHTEFLIGACEDVLGQTRAGYAVVVAGGLVLTHRHCVGAPNSAGPGAWLDHSGTLSVARDDFALRAGPCPPNQFGLFFSGTQALAVTFGDGFRCVGGGAARLGVRSTGSSGTAELPLDLGDPHLPAGGIIPGSTFHFQFWYRDPVAGLAGFNLSDALTGSFSP